MVNEWPDWMRLNPNLSGLKPYGAPQIDVPVRLNTNENPYPLDSNLQNEIMSQISREIEGLNRYPDRDATVLRKTLADYVNQISSTSFSEANVWVANGSNEILQSIVLAFHGEAMGFEPSYSMHPLISRSVGKNWISIKRRSDFSLDVTTAMNAISEHKPGIVFLTTPNNPTGDSISVADIAQIAQVALENTAIVVVDEAYFEFSNHDSAVGLIAQFPNLVVSRTMSKAFAFAGARVGYLVADPKIIEAMLLIRLPYHLSNLTQAAALAALKSRNRLSEDVVRIKQDRELLVASLKELGLSVINSDANFVLFSGFPMSSQELWKELVSQGVLIRDVGIPGYLRATIGTYQENAALLSALEQSLAK